MPTAATTPSASLQAGFNNSRVNNPNAPERFWQPLYDRMNYPTAGLQQIQFFSIPLGQATTLIVNGTSTATTPKTFLDTNLQTGNMSPQKAYLIKGLSLGFVHSGTTQLQTNPFDRAKIVNMSWFQFSIGDKSILVLPSMIIPEMTPLVSGSSTVNNTSTFSYAGGGGYAGLVMYKFDDVTLDPGSNFFLTMNIGRGTLETVTTAVDIVVMLQAYMLRAS